ncbi:carbohydrate ABC transporter permease [Cohnella hongkongensis]|uniref:Carbohydrate ABC transporter permease n=1 Tax=Cohnella hongkongensis TaxID=178337 RepID=A0ABV9F6J0_9BACL
MNSIRKLSLEALILLIALLFLSPFYFVFINSVKGFFELMTNVAGWPKHFVWANYANAWEALNYPKAFLNSLLVTVIGVTGIVVFSSMAAYRIVRHDSAFNRILLVLFIAAMVIPFQSIMIPLSVVSSSLGILNQVWGLAVIYWGLGLSLATFLLQGFVRTIPYELEESAIIDGCSPYGVFWRIVFPLLKPMIVTVIILNTLWLWNDYLLPSLILSDLNVRTIPLATYSFFAEYLKQWDLGLAGLVLSIAPLLLFFLLMQKHIIEGVTAGSVKG